MLLNWAAKLNCVWSQRGRSYFTRPLRDAFARCPLQPFIQTAVLYYLAGFSNCVKIEDTNETAENTFYLYLLYHTAHTRLSSRLIPVIIVSVSPCVREIRETAHTLNCFVFFSLHLMERHFVLLVLFHSLSVASCHVLLCFQRTAGTICLLLWQDNRLYSTCI